jgi:hypothetical protein
MMFSLFVKLQAQDKGLLLSCYHVKKTLGLVLALKSGLKVPLLPLGPNCPLQTILPSDLIGCASQTLQMVMAIWRNFFLNLKPAKMSLLSAEGCHAPTQQVQI